jgi:uncharacterized protein (DUF2235 family)
LGKNIVVCCDGTGNEFKQSNSNVVKLYTCLEIKEGQRGYYHPGVGTMGAPNRSTWIGRLESKVAGLAFGAGFTDALEDAYRYLMDHYEDGDNIYLFGFSRGAYGVRALAGALYMYGLLCPGNEGHIPYLLRMYSKESRRAFKNNEAILKKDDSAEAFKATFSREVPIHFVGVWDTVSSIGWVYDPVKLLFDGQNPVVRRARHAMSINERRCFFQAYLLGRPLPPEQTPILKGEQQDIVQAWFAGVHSDVGGGYGQEECGPAEVTLQWMLEEAEAVGLVINQAKKAAVLGLEEHSPVPEQVQTIAEFYKPRPKHGGASFHESLTWQWRPLEVFPHKYFDMNGKKQWEILPRSHRREIPEGALFHPSVKKYLDDKLYSPPENLDPTCLRPLSDSPVGLEELPIPEVQTKLAKAGFYVYRHAASKQSLSNPSASPA